ncbi:hypothetical protein P3T23_000602 [Paraburkholderia sp. GAS448]
MTAAATALRSIFKSGGREPGERDVDSSGLGVHRLTTLFSQDGTTNQRTSASALDPKTDFSQAATARAAFLPRSHSSASRRDVEKTIRIVASAAIVGLMFSRIPVNI